MKVKKTLTLVKEAAPLVAILRVIVENRMDMDPKIKLIHDYCDVWLHSAYEKLTREVAK